MERAAPLLRVGLRRFPRRWEAEPGLERLPARLPRHAEYPVEVWLRARASFLLRLLRVSVFKVLANVVHSYCKLFTNGSISRPSRCGCGLCRLFFPRVLSPPVSRRPSAVLIRSPRTGPEWPRLETSLPQLPPSPREPFHGRDRKSDVFE